MPSPQKLAALECNYLAFRTMLPNLLPLREGQYALMRGGSIIGYFDDVRVALDTGKAQFSDDLFSVQEVTDRKADFGWFSCASHNEAI